MQLLNYFDKKIKILPPPTIIFLKQGRGCCRAEINCVFTFKEKKELFFAFDDFCQQFFGAK